MKENFDTAKNLKVPNKSSFHEQIESKFVSD